MLAYKLIYLFAVVSLSDCAGRSFDVNFISATCTYNSDIIYIDCGTSMFENKTVINYEGYPIKVIDEFHAHVIIDFKRKNYDTIRLFEVHQNGCAFLESVSKQSIVIIIRKMFDQFGVYPKECPITPGHKYSLKNLYLDAEYLPPYTPEAVFTLTITLSTRDTKILTSTLYGEIVQKNAGKRLLY